MLAIETRTHRRTTPGGLWHHQHPLCMQVRQPADCDTACRRGPWGRCSRDTDLCPASPASWGAAVQSQEQPVRSVRTTPLCSWGRRRPPGSFLTWSPSSPGPRIVKTRKGSLGATLASCACQRGALTWTLGRR